VRRILAPVLLALTLAAPVARAQDAAEGPQSAPLSAEQMAALDKDFNAAVQAARASLPVFWQRLASTPDTGPGIFSLKVSFKSPRGGTEELWLQDIKREGSRIVGRLNYDPQTLTTLHRMDIVPIREADIIDWSFKEGRKRYGEYTTRVLAKLNPQESAKTMATLSDNPLPADARK
jgi:uncharacterized protein YegJ (DUF2314 family)